MLCVCLKGEFPDCPFVAIKNISAKTFGHNHLVAEDDQLVLNLTQQARDSRCGISGHMTNLPGIWVVPASQGGQLKRVDQHDVVEEFELAAGLGYLEYVLMNKMTTQKREMTSSLCDLENKQVAWDSPILLRGNQYLLSRGDVYMTFTCPTKKGTLRRSDQCYKQIPLTNGGYMDLSSRLLVKKPEPVACSQHFPVVVRTEEGWVELPVLKAIPAPAPGHHGLNEVDAFTDFSVTNIYTKTELEDFHQLLSFPEYRESKLSEILYGDCVQDGTCATSQITGVLGQLRSNLAGFLDLETQTKDVQRLLDQEGPIGGYLDKVFMPGKAGVLSERDKEYGTETMEAD